MPATTRSSPAATAAAEPQQPSSSRQPLRESEIVAADSEGRAEEGSPDLATPTPQDWLRAIAKINSLEKELRGTQEALIGEKKALGPVDTTAREAELLKLLEKYPPLIALVDHWPEVFRDQFPQRQGAVKPVTIELSLEQHRTYRKLTEDKKEGQRADFAAIADIYVWTSAYTKALDELLQDLLPDEDYNNEVVKYFNGLYDAIEMAAKRISFIQIKAHPEEFDEGFQHAVALSLNQAKVHQQLPSIELAYSHLDYTKHVIDKSFLHSAKKVAQSAFNKSAAPHQAAGEKSNKKRAARKRPEERPAPQA